MLYLDDSPWIMLLLLPLASGEGTGTGAPDVLLLPWLERLTTTAPPTGRRVAAPCPRVRVHGLEGLVGPTPTPTRGHPHP